MSRRVQYSLNISNPELGEFKEVKGYSRAEVEAKAAKQIAIWDKKVTRQREQQKVADLRRRAEMQSDEAQTLIDEYEGILQATLVFNDRLDWNLLYDNRVFVSEKYNGKPPTIESIREEIRVPEQSFLEPIWSAKKNRRLELEELASQTYLERREKYLEQVDLFTKQQNQVRAEFEQNQSIQHDEINRFKAGYEKGEKQSVEDYFDLVLERSQYPEGFEYETLVDFDPIGQTLIVNFRLPTPENIPNIVEYRFIQSRKIINSIEMKKREFEQFYNSVVFQITLRTIHEIFESDYANNCNVVVFNGWIQGVNKSTGSDFTAVTISCQAERSVFESIDLSRVDPQECVRGLKGLVGGSLTNLAPVRPIMQISRDDDRFVESREILADLDSSRNLAQMPWEEFEHLVRELFNAIFEADGGEVKVTRASRDGGIDAVAFDPTPIRGGKFVIQAKRYNGLVSPSAARDLYGAMLDEGASKGLLVTTGYFGHGSREFVKDKPIELIDGSSLVYLFQEHGHNVRIELTK